MWKLLVAVTVLIAPLAVVQGNVLQIHTPPSQVSVSHDRVHVIGQTTAATVRVLLNGLPISELKPKDSVFHAHVEFGYGLNDIELIPLDEDGLAMEAEAKSLQIMYGPTISRKYQKMYPKYMFHSTVPQTLCTDCHLGVDTEQTGGADEVACQGCHADVIERFKKHTQVDNRACVNCHKIDRDLAYGSVDAEQTNPCFQCHKDKIGEYAQEYIHGPVAGGGCVVCHNPHGSKYEKNLRHPVQILCLTCHEDMEEELERKFVHKPFLDGRCTGCHDPHSTGNKWILIKSSESVCLSCHLEQGTLQSHRHPYNVAPKKKLRVDLKLTERGLLECISCHEPHAGNAAHLLKISNDFSCAACHDDK